LAFFGSFGPLPCFTSLLCLLWSAVFPACLSRGCALLSRGALSVSSEGLGPARLRLSVGCGVSVSVGFGCRVPVAPFRPVWPFQGVEQVFNLLIRTSVSNKCSKVKVEAFLANLSEFSTESDRISTESSLSVEPNLDRISESLSLTFEPNPNRISRSSQEFYFVSGLFPRRALQDLCAGASGLLGSPGIKWSAWNGSSILMPSLHRWQ
jgi:hypothetical protein